MPSRSSKEARLGRYPNRNKKPDLGRTKSEIGFGKSQKAAGNAVSRTNLGKSSSSSPKPPKAPRARRNPLATPEVGKALDNLRKRYTPPGRTRSEQDLKDNMSLQTERNASERKLEDAALRDFPTRPEALAAEPKIRQNTSLNAEGTTVERYRGRKPVGTPRVGEATRAARDGKLRRDGKRFTTPEVRQTRRKVRRAKREVRRARSAVAKGGMPANVPAEYAKWIRKYSPRIDKMARQTYGLSGNEFMAKMLQGESGFDMSKVGPSTPYGNARGAAQFIPPTRDAFVEKFGIDPWRSTREAVQSMALHLDGKSYSKTFGIQGYNPGINDSYYLDQDVGPTTKPSPGARRRLERATEQAGSVAQKAANLGLSVQGLVTPKQVKAMGLKVKKNPLKPTLWAQPKKAKGEPVVEWLNGTTPDGINPDIVALARTISRTTGLDIRITSALRPESSGSNHQVGGALDIDAIADGGERERQGDAIAYAAVIAAGGSKEDAQALASGAVGYVGFVSPNGQPVEFLWKGDGDHRDHVHIAVESGQSRGEKVFKGRTAIDQGILTDGAGSAPVSSGGSSSSGSTTSGGATPSSGPVGRKTRQQRIIQQLRALGYRVNSKGIKKIDDAPEEAEETLSEMRKRYGIK